MSDSDTDREPGARRDSFSDTYLRTITEQAARLVAEQSVGSDEAVDRAAQAGVKALSQVTPAFVQTLKDTAPAMMTERAGLHQRFTDRLRRHWGAAFDLFFTITVCAEEFGSQYCSRSATLVTGPDRDLLEAIAGVHARACRTAVETYHLLVAGLPFGALARSRTLHELAVMSTLLADFGRTPEHSDLGARYLAFDAMQNLMDAENYQKFAGRLNYQPFSADEMEALAQERVEALQRFPDLDAKNGWAAVIAGRRSPGFDQLEVLAGLDHLRPYYDWASHEVHANPKGTRLNVLTRGGHVYRSTGYSDAGLGDPGQMALISLHQVTTALLSSGREVSPSDLLGIQGMAELVTEACETFASSEIAKRERDTPDLT